jgi:Nucleotide modification associated domain 1
MSATSKQYDKIIAKCKDIFVNKMKDYGSAWRILRPSSITDQIFIKAQRIRSIEEKGMQKVEDGIIEEFMGIVNYAVIALTQLELGPDGNSLLSLEEGRKHFESHTAKSKSLMENKNHDYDEAWRKMRVSSITDLILMKLFRLKQIEDNKGETIISEGLDANYLDIINYAVFALIKIDEAN